MRNALANKLWVFKYRMGLFVFRWVIDEDDDIGLQICRIVTLVKYKEMTIIYWRKRVKFSDAPKYVNIDSRGL